MSGAQRGGMTGWALRPGFAPFDIRGGFRLGREAILPNVPHFIGTQFGRRAKNLDDYAVRQETRREHLA